MAGLGYPGAMETHPLVSLLKSTGTTPAELTRKLAAAKPCSVILSTVAVQGWYQGRTVPRDAIRPVVADVLGLNVDAFLRACAGLDGAQAAQ